jgi:hypothetical protein
LIEQDHRPVKRRNKFYRSLRTASTTIKGMEAIRGLYKKTRKEGTLFGFSVCTENQGIIGNPSLNHRYRKGFYSLFKTLQQNRISYKVVKILGVADYYIVITAMNMIYVFFRLLV